jgi:hypothetical protein
MNHDAFIMGKIGYTFVIISLTSEIWEIGILKRMITTQEFQIEKLQLVEAEKKKIRQEYERKEKQVDIKKKM